MRSTAKAVLKLPGYMLDLAIIAVAVIAFTLGLLHRVAKSDDSGAIAYRQAATVALGGSTIFSIDTVSSRGGTKVFGGMGTFKVAARRGEIVSLAGWAVDQANQSPALGVSVQVDGGAIFVSDYGLQRPDVAKVFGAPDYLNSGFKAQLPQFAAGLHRLSLLILSAKSHGYYLEKDRVILEVR